tara:strand:- start:704 stop:841 length:138 start_codon:yes stop_codon:yes gene_type:complete
LSFAAEGRARRVLLDEGAVAPHQGIDACAASPIALTTNGAFARTV